MISQPNSTVRLRHNLKYSNSDSLLSNVMIGAGETFLPAFVLALGFGQITSGLATALPFLVASVIQLAAPWAVRKVGSYRRWLTALAALQGLSFLPLVYGAWTGSMSQILVFAMMTLYWTCSLASGPAWNSWMTSLVPLAVRARYFAVRGRFGQMGILLGLVAAGLSLSFGKGRGGEMLAFAALFAVSGVSRLISSWCLNRQSERPRLTEIQKRVPFHELLRRMKTSRDGQLILFLAIFQIAVNIAGPYFNPFMLKQLDLSYMAYMGLIATSFVTKILIFPRLGVWGKRVGPFRLLRWSVLGGALMPVLWMISPSYPWLLLTQIISGIIWAIFDLGVMLALFEAIRDDERTGFLSLYNFVNALAVLIGTLIGAEFLKVLGQTHFAYMAIFALSAATRLLCVAHLEHVVLRTRINPLPAAIVWLHLQPPREPEPSRTSRALENSNAAAIVKKSTVEKVAVEKLAVEKSAVKHHLG